MNTKTVNALKDLYIANGGSISDVVTINTIPDMIEKISDISLINNLTVESPDPELEVFGVKVKVFQQNVMDVNGIIYGILLKQDVALWNSGPLAGTGIFLALKINADFKFDKIKVGLVPSATDMAPVELDEDMIVVFKLITPEAYQPIEQKVKVIVTINGVDYIKYYTLAFLNVD